MSFDKFRKHQKTCLIVFAVALIVPMGIGGSFMAIFGRNKIPRAGIIDGRKISGREFDSVPYLWHRVLGFFPTLDNSRNPTDEDKWAVLCTLALAEKWGIEASGAEVARMTQLLLNARGVKADGAGLNNYLQSVGLKWDQFNRTITQIVVYQKTMLGYLYGQTIYPTKAKAYDLFKKENKKAKVEFVKLDAENFKVEKPTNVLDKEIAAYYAKNKDAAWLEVPEKVVIEYFGAAHREYEDVLAAKYYAENKKAEWLTTTRPAIKKGDKEKPSTKPAVTATKPVVKRIMTLDEARDEIIKRLGRNKIRAEFRSYMSEAEGELGILKPTQENMIKIAKAYGLTANIIKPVGPVGQNEMFGGTEPLFGWIMPGGRYDPKIKQFGVRAFDADLNKVYSVENMKGIYLYRVIDKIVSHSPLLNEGDTKKKIADFLKNEDAKNATNKEAEKLAAIWKEGRSKLVKALEKNKKVKLESKEIGEGDALPFAFDAFETKAGGIKVKISSDGCYIWRLDKLIDAGFDIFTADEKKFRDMARMNQMKSARKLWRAEILKLLEEDNLVKLREALARRKKDEDEREKKEKEESKKR